MFIFADLPYFFSMYFVTLSMSASVFTVTPRFRHYAFAFCTSVMLPAPALITNRLYHTLS